VIEIAATQRVAGAAPTLSAGYFTQEERCTMQKALLTLG
jgi:hypothetical protein